MTEALHFLFHREIGFLGGVSGSNFFLLFPCLRFHTHPLRRVVFCEPGPYQLKLSLIGFAHSYVSKRLFLQSLPSFSFLPLPGRPETPDRMRLLIFSGFTSVSDVVTVIVTTWEEVWACRAGGLFYDLFIISKVSDIEAGGRAAGSGV